MIKSLDPFKPCEFLKTHAEIDFSNQLMSKHQLLLNPCDCKNWDLAHVLMQLSHGNILDMGCQGSYVLANAVHLGLEGEKIGIDLVALPPMQGATLIQGDITHTTLPSSHFDTITCMSVIEHGVNLKDFRDECARLLKVGGTLYVSFDYWPNAIVHNTRLFNAAWTIFSQRDVLQLLNLFQEVGMEPVGEIDWTTQDGVIRPGYYSPGPMRYTFGLLQLRKVREIGPGAGASTPVIAPETPPRSTPGNDVLFVNNAEPACGVYQFGQRVFDALAARQKHYRFHLAECTAPASVLAATRQLNPCAVVFNYHPLTQRFVDRDLVHQTGVPCFGIYHEITPEIARLPRPPQPFDHWFHSDPSLTDQSDFMRATARPLIEYQNNFPVPAIPTIGTFGFGFANKGFERLAHLVQEQFEEAVLRMHIPHSAYMDPDGSEARQRETAVREIITSPRIRLEITHHLMSNADLLDFLAKNTVNAFLYDAMENRGISSVVDYALSVDRPIAITRTSMFRHIFDARPSIVVEESSLPQIINQGVEPIRAFKTAWSNEVMAGQYEDFISQVVGSRVAVG